MAVFDLLTTGLPTPHLPYSRNTTSCSGCLEAEFTRPATDRRAGPNAMNRLLSLANHELVLESPPLHTVHDCP